MKIRNQKKRAANLAIKNQQNVNIKQQRKANVKREKERVVERTIFKPEEASIVEQENYISQPEEAVLVVVKQEEVVDEKSLSLKATATEQSKQKANHHLILVGLPFYFEGTLIVDGSTTPKDRYCSVCKVIFSSKGHCRKHMQKYHIDNVPYAMNKYTIQPNILPDVDDPNNHCRLCSHKFASKQVYKMHLQSIHKMKLEPPVKRHRVKHNLQADEIPDVNDPNNYCRACHYEYASKWSFRNHLTRIHGMKLEPLVKRYRVGYNLQADEIPDVNDPNCYCRACHHEYTCIWSFRRHLQTIHKMKLEPLVRRPCPKRIINPDIIPDVNDPNYDCRACNHEYADKRSYRRHLQTIHKMKLEPLAKRPHPKRKIESDIVPDVNDPNYNCRACNYKFASKWSYRNHLMDIHGMKL
jgi:hypothetical protein